MPKSKSLANDHPTSSGPGRRRRRPGLRLATAGAGLAVLALVAAACGGGSSSSTTTTKAAPASGSTTAAAPSGSSSTAGGSSTTTSASGSADLAGAQQVVNQALKTPTWQGPTASVKASSAKGKSVWLVNLTEEIPALHEWAAVAAGQLDAVGAHAQICDAKGTPEGITSCLQQAISAKPAVIVAMALDTAFIHNYIAQANAAGIKVITAQTGTPGAPKGTGAVAEVTFNYPQVGKILGAWYSVTSKCHSAPQIITSTSSRQPSLAEVAGIQSEIARACPSVKPLPVQNVLIPDWPTKLSTVTRSLLTANTNLQYLLPLYDGMTIYMVQEIKQLNLGRTVEMGSFNATPVVVQNELAKKTALVADVGGPNDWYGYALADETFRVLTGTPVVVNEKVPLRLFTAANLGTINLSGKESTWYGPVDFACNYHKLWGLSCK
ncbi:MAG: sugar ABC transporter substrate-binding protein [Acidimicrobiales bacterium]